jgi:hypothetical protein
MTVSAAALVVALIRGWTRCYTWRVPDASAVERRAEIESDLWESLHDRVAESTWRISCALLSRLVAGLADDVAWRLEMLDGETAFRTRRAVAMTVSIVLVAATLAVPARLAHGRIELDACAAAAPAADSTAAYRLQVMTCAGAFFQARD